MKGKVIFKPFFIFFVYPLRGHFPIGKKALKKTKTDFLFFLFTPFWTNSPQVKKPLKKTQTDFSFYLYTQTPKFGVYLIHKCFFGLKPHPNGQGYECKNCGHHKHWRFSFQDASANHWEYCVKNGLDCEQLQASQDDGQACCGLVRP